MNAVHDSKGVSTYSFIEKMHLSPSSNAHVTKHGGYNFIYGIEIVHSFKQGTLLGSNADLAVRRKFRLQRLQWKVGTDVWNKYVIISHDPLSADYYWWQQVSCTTRRQMETGLLYDPMHDGNRCPV